MKAEIMAVGTELLLGQIVNSNAQYLSQQLAGAGIDVYYQTVVGDNMLRIEQALQLASSRSDLIILTGGLGPTEDDLTRDVVAAFIGSRLVEDPSTLDKIRAYFEQRQTPMTENNRRQALMIEGGTPLPNDSGMAVGTALEHKGVKYILLPGPPRELKPMFENYALPWITQSMKMKPLYSKMLKFAGIGESSLASKLEDLIQTQVDPTLAPYAKEGEVTLRVSTKAEHEQQAFEKMEPLIKEIKRRVGEYIYAQEEIALENALIQLLSQQAKQLAVAESCTGGLISQLLTSVPGSSSVFQGAVISYTNHVKQDLLQVPGSLLEGKNAPGAVSRETAYAMAEQALKLMGSDYSISVTGVAGPASQEDKPVGLVYIGIGSKSMGVKVYEEHLNGNRELVRLRAAKRALYLLWRTLKN